MHLHAVERLGIAPPVYSISENVSNGGLIASRM